MCIPMAVDSSVLLLSCCITTLVLGSPGLLLSCSTIAFTLLITLTLTRIHLSTSLRLHLHLHAGKDTEHSLNTLRHACLMDGQQDGAPQPGSETRFMTGGRKSDTVQVGEVNVTEISRKNMALKKAGR